MSVEESLTALVVMIGAYLFWPFLLAGVIILGFMVVSAGIFVYAAVVDMWHALTKRMRGKARPEKAHDPHAALDIARRRTLKERRVNR